MIEGMFCQVAQEFAERLGTVKAMTFGKLLYLLEALIPAQREGVRHSHLTRRNSPTYLTLANALCACNGIKPSETSSS
jgi:hypothetical protein